MNKKTGLWDWLGFRDYPDFSKSRLFGGLCGVLLCFVAVSFIVLWIWAFCTAFYLMYAIYHPVGKPEISVFSVRQVGAFLAAVLGAPLLFYGIYQKQRGISQKDTELEFEKQGHITDRINKAVENLEATRIVKMDGVEKTVPNLGVRMAGILALERIAQDCVPYNEGRDHITIMEILCDYLRMNSRQAHEENPEKAREDIQKAITVIGRRSEKQIAIERERSYRLDLMGIQGYSIDFNGDFSYVELRGAILPRAFLYKVTLECAQLDHVDFNGATFWDVDLSKAAIGFSLDNIFGGGNIVLPEYVSRPDRWP